MQFPEDFARFEKLSPLFGQVKDSSLFWINCLASGHRNLTDNPKVPAAHSQALKDISWGGVIYAAKNDPRIDGKAGNIQLPNIHSLHLTEDDKSVLTYLFLSRLAAEPSLSNEHGRLADSTLEENSKVVGLLSSRFAAFEALKDAFLFEHVLEPMAATTLWALNNRDNPEIKKGVALSIKIGE